MKALQQLDSTHLDLNWCERMRAKASTRAHTCTRMGTRVCAHARAHTRACPHIRVPTRMSAEWLVSRFACLMSYQSTARFAPMLSGIRTVCVTSHHRCPDLDRPAIRQLCSYNVGPRNAVALLSSLRENITLETIDLSNSAIGEATPRPPRLLRLLLHHAALPCCTRSLTLLPRRPSAPLRFCGCLSRVECGTLRAMPGRVRGSRLCAVRRLDSRA